MSYASTVTVYRGQQVGTFILQIDDTGAGATSEKQLDLQSLGIPNMGRIVQQTASLRSGSGATIAPQLAYVASATHDTDIVCQSTAAAEISNLAAVPIPFQAQGYLYHRPTPNAGTDNAVRTVYVVQVGWSN